MATSRIYLSGGPCNGTTVPASEIQGGIVAYIACGGGYYVNPGTGQHRRGNLVFTWAGTTQPGPPSGGPPGSGVAPQAHRGWGDLRRTINHNLPAALAAINRNQQAALRELGHRRRVRR